MFHYQLNSVNYYRHVGNNSLTVPVTFMVSFNWSRYNHHTICNHTMDLNRQLFQQIIPLEESIKLKQKEDTHTHGVIQIIK